MLDLIKEISYIEEHWIWTRKTSYPSELPTPTTFQRVDLKIDTDLDNVNALYFV